MPLLERHCGLNVTTQQLPRNFSKPFASPSRPLTPHSEPHEFRPPPPSPWTSSPPADEYPRLRRKPSRSNLTRALHEPATGEARVTCTTPTLASFSQQELVSPLLPPSTSTPASDPTPTSPSLSSTISTLASTPTHSPIFPGSSWLQQWRAADSRGHQGPVATKRKFPSFRSAKRLPRRAAADWYVYAAVIETEDEVGAQIAESDSDRGGCAGAERRETAKRGRSVRFAGIAEDGSSSGTGENTSGEEKETIGGSSYSLSKFKFPTPPGHVTWADTFGHLGEPTPPTSPTTLHYKGASFDLVNPHASLLLGKHNIETPGEIDGLLDDYFSDRSDMPYNPQTGEMSSSPVEAGESGSRRGRMLYNDPVSARQTIMRIPNTTITGATSSLAHQDSPLAGRGRAPNLPLGTTHLTQPDEAHASAPAYDVERESSGLSAGMPGERGSSVYPHSTRSEPFDLSVSEDEEPQYSNLDQMVARGPGRYYADHLNQRDESGELAVYDEGADATARNASQGDRDTTIGNIVEAYDHSSVPHTPEYDDDQTLTSIPSMPSFEHGRGLPRSDDSGAVFSDDHGYYRSSRVPERDTRSARFGEPPGVPAPTPPTRLTNQHESPELLTSDQTYGATGELLEITPATRAQGSSSYPYPTGGSQIPPMDYDHMNCSQSNKENILPHDSAMAFAGIPPAWSNVDLPVRIRGSLNFDDRGLSRNPMARVSSAYSADDENAWEDDTQASQSQPNLMEGPQRQSQISYADISDDEDDRGLLAPPPKSSQGQPALQKIHTRDGAGTKVQFAHKAHRMLLSRPDEKAHYQDVDRAKAILKASILHKNVGESHGGWLGAVPAHGKDRMRSDERELESLRQKNSLIVREAVDAVAEEEYPRQPRGRRVYDPRNSFENVMRKCGLGSDNRSVASSSRAGLLDEEQRSPQTPGELFYSPTVNTFRTAPRTVRSMPGLAQGQSSYETRIWSPLDPRFPDNVMMSGGRGTITPSSVRTGNVAEEEYELSELRRCGGSRPAMSSQTGLLPIHLTSTNQDSTTTTFVPGRRLTDAELMEREPGWTMGGPRSNPRSRFGLDLPVNTITQPMLLDRDDFINASMIKEQGEISQRWFCLSALCPVTALLFGLGRLDGRAQTASKGRVMEMRPRDKRYALYMAMPLGLILYAIAGIVVFLAVVLSRD